jgi:hypothetical protein
MACADIASITVDGGTIGGMAGIGISNLINKILDGV